MSRVGQKPITLPAGVEAVVNERTLKIKGKGGELSMNFSPLITVKKEGNVLTFTPVNKTKQARMDWGTTRSRANSMVKGVTEGFKQKMQLQGVGYRAEMKGKTLSMKVGHSHEDISTPPTGVNVKVDKQTDIEISGADKQAVGQYAALLHLTKPPEPYKAKGVHYEGQEVERKEGKKK
ncbi:MAG: 50S ribosomal protein L6 [Alphaproteobacteria bacterium]|nr:MAG: 50S ribosomal protein L6 [Alphaproteobacteria bacterium]